MSKWIRCCHILCVAGVALSTSAAELKPGAEVNAIIPASGKRVVVFQPSTYDPGKRWPFVFYYHGTGGEPNIRLLQRHGVGASNILVGISYLERSEAR